MNLNDISRQIIGCGIRVHSALGPGLLESAYESCLASAIRRTGLQVETQVPLTVEFEGVRIDCAFRLDLVVEERVVVEIKAISNLLPVHEAQLLSYLKLGRFELGLLFNFHEVHLREGIRRMINQIAVSSSVPSAYSVVKRPAAT